MPRQTAPALPTEKSIEMALQVVRKSFPNARIKRIGPEGVEFDYPNDAPVSDSEYRGKPFGAP